MKLRNITESPSPDNLLEAFNKIDMDDAMYRTDNCYAFAYHVNTGTLFVDWVKDRAHRDWFSDKRFGMIHEREIVQARVDPDYWNYGYHDGDIESTNLWGRFGVLKLDDNDIEEKNIADEVVVSRLLNGVPSACVWAIGDLKYSLGSLSMALEKHGLPKDAVIFSAYKSEQFDFPPFYIGEAHKSPKKEVKTFTQRWKSTIGDSIERD